MNLLSGIQLMKQKRQAAKSGLIAADAAKLAAVGLVGSISDAIRNKDSIKTRKVMDSAFAKISTAARDLQRGGRTSPEFAPEEERMMSSIGEAVRSGVWGVVKYVGKKLFSAFYKGVRLTITPIFRIFCSTVNLVFRTLLANPYTLAATALIGAAVAGYKLYRNRDDSLRGEIPATPEAPEAPRASESTQSSNPVNKASSVRDIIISAAKRNGVPVGLALKMAGAESSYNASVTNKTGSTGKGLFQFIDETWRIMGGKPGEQFDPYKNADLGTKYIKNNIDHLRKSLGRDPAYHEVYAAHFFGPGVSRMLQNMDLSAPIETGLAKFHSKAGIALVMKLNPVLRKKTIGQVIEYLKRKVGDTKVGAGLAENIEYAEDSPKHEEPRSPIKATPAELASTGRFMIPASGTYTSAFGKRAGGGMVSLDHQGIDIANAVGTPIHAADGGVVVVSSTVSYGYGTRIDIRHDNGLVTRYGHSSKLFVREGDRVGKGQVIAAMGNQGNSTGPHLHFEVLTATAKRIDPATVIPGLPVAKSRISTEQVALSRSYVETNFVRVDGKMIAVKG